MTKWNDLAHKASPERRARIKAEAKAELERVGLGKLRRARQMTQVELSYELGLPQASVSDMEHREDMLFSTLSKFVEALGGKLQVNAVFPDATFDLVLEAQVKTGRTAKREESAAA